MRLATNTISTNKSLTKRLVMGFAALATAAVVGTAGIVNAQSGGNPPSEFCKQGNFKNDKQCAKAWKKKNRPGSGYGGNITNNTNVSTNVNVGTSGDDNIIEIVINYFFN